jgi:hypothetical protein
VFLSPPTRELQLLRSFQRRKFLRRKLGRSMFGSGNGLLLWCLDIAGGRRVPILVLVSCRLLVVVRHHGMWDIVVLLKRFIRKVDFAQVWAGTRVYLVTERREMAPWVASRRLPWTSGKASVHHSLDVCNLHTFLSSNYFSLCVLHVSKHKGDAPAFKSLFSTSWTICHNRPALHWKLSFLINQWDLVGSLCESSYWLCVEVENLHFPQILTLLMCA